MIKGCLTGMLLFSLKVWSQNIQALHVGDRVPQSIVNSYAFKDKLIILDFMATNCPACVHALPRFDSIQKENGSKMKILLVTGETKGKLKKFLEHHHQEIKLETIEEDTVLAKYFPHRFISHEVWIKDGMVKAITEADYVNNKNVGTLLAGNKITWPVKNDFAGFNYTVPIFKPISRSYSRFRNAIANVSSKFLDTVYSDISRITAINFSIIDLYLHSYNIASFPLSRIILKVKDTSRFMNKNKYKAEWKLENTSCYEQVAPVEIPPAQQQEKMRNDLDHHFKLKGRIVKRFLPCFVIKRSQALTETFALPPLRKISLNALVFAFNASYTGKPCINESGLEKRILVNDNFLEDTALLKKALRNAGLELVTEKRETKVLVITDK